MINTYSQQTKSSDELQHLAVTGYAYGLNSLEGDKTVDTYNLGELKWI